MHKFLLEIGVEEVPARFLPPGLNMLRENALNLLQKYSLDFSNIKTCATPRRLVLLIEGLPDKQKDVEKEVWGPPKKTAFDEKGAPTKTLKGFCSALGIDINSIEIKKKDKGEYVVAKFKERGQPAKSLLGRFAIDLINSLNFPKSMRWADHSIKFVRPIRWLLALFNSEVVDFELDGIRSDRYSWGHRFLSKERIIINHPDEYFDKLFQSSVIVDHEKRKELIILGIKRLADSSGLRVHEDNELLEHVNYLVEYPRAVMGSFPAEYLQLPPELLITVMRDHQKYFALYNEKGLANKFLLISNTSEENDPVVRAGAERVIKARFEDARFYFTEDRKKTLADRIEDLKKVVYHEKLGTLYEKTLRIRHITQYLADRIAPERKTIIERAAMLAKTDLLTGVVREFPELQGIMGYYYAINDGESEEIALAIKEHYLPQRSGDRNPSTEEGIILSIADKIDNIVSFFGLGLEPTGSEDPFALRRQTMAIISMLKEKNYNITMEELVKVASKEFTYLNIPFEKIINFINQRFENMLEVEDYSTELISSLSPYMAKVPVGEIISRLNSLEIFKKEPFYPDFILAAKRVFNILSKSYNPAPLIDEALFETEEERKLFLNSKRIEKEIEGFLKDKDFISVLKSLTSLVPDINSFFDRVLVMVRDEKIRDNRLNLLSHVWKNMLKIADFSKISS
ncbi:MAG: glycine--tRNA ligase subunit beta [Thermodesulfovibrionales bacterium]|nr:glycine--tRNA ligase subunit beta [Thermodesulfovibrionales bacterium]